MSAEAMDPKRLDEVRAQIESWAACEPGSFPPTASTVLAVLAVLDKLELEVGKATRRYESRGAELESLRGRMAERTAEWKQALGERDEANARAKRYRDRCTVEAEDVTVITRPKAESWLASNGWEHVENEDYPSVWMPSAPTDKPGAIVDLDEPMEFNVRRCARVADRDAWAILEEMSAASAEADR